MFGVMAGLVCNAMPDPSLYLMPWDMPVMFFFTVAFIAYRKKSWPVLIAAVLTGSVIKETALVASLFLLAAPWKYWVRGLAIIGLFAASQWITLSISPADAPLSWKAGAGNFWANFHAITLFKFWPDIFANAGGLVLLVYCLFHITDWGLRAVVLCFIVGLKYTEVSTAWYSSAHPVYTEFRDWCELLPLSWITINDVLFNRKA